MTYFQGKSILITGASSGIGEALVRKLSDENCSLFIAARSLDKLESLKKELSDKKASIHCLTLDLADDNSMEEAVKALQRETEQLDILINNAGISQRGYALETDFSVIEKIMNVNFRGTTFLTSLCFPLLKKAQTPHIIVNSSVVGEYGFPLRSAYSASKHALKGYFQSMQLEPNTPLVSIVSAGGINTEISKNALNSSGETHGKVDPRIKSGISAEKAALKILRGASKRKKNIFIGSGEIVLLYISRFCPPLYRRIAKNISAQ